MIFVTVGTQLPFDRLVKAVDEWAGRTGAREVVAQTGPGQYQPMYLQHQPFVTPAEFKRYAAEAELIIAHAGMGSIISALGMGRPILVMPRVASLGEHRNDHQLSTARRFKELGRVQVAMDEFELTARLDSIGTYETQEPIGKYASDELLTRIRTFMESRA